MTLIGEVIGGPLNVWMCLYLIIKDYVIYEHKFRLMFPVLIGITGFFGFGATVHYQAHWIGHVLTFGLVNMAIAFDTGCVWGYVLDSHQDLSEEGLNST